jgi:drug/metabolite transporter (DMT)-like permease
MSPTAPARASRARILAAFAAVYVIWGSTYLGIKFAAETLPPFLMAGARFMTAGALLYAWVALRPTRAAGPSAGASAGSGAPGRPSLAEWGWAVLVGGLLLFGGNGAVVWATGRVPTGVIALLVAATPVWMVLLDWLRPGGVRPGGLVAAGLLLGTVGLGLLVSARAGAGGSGIGGGRIDPLGAAVVLLGSFCWAVGSLASRRPPPSRVPLRATAMQMLGGGALLTLAALAAGDGSRFDPAHVSLRSWTAWAYLVTFGSIVGYSAFIWLLAHVSAAKVATYAYVNPIVAVALGWAFAAEPVTPQMLAAAAVIVGAVALITIGQSRVIPVRPTAPRHKPPHGRGHPAEAAVRSPSASGGRSSRLAALSFRSSPEPSAEGRAPQLGEPRAEGREP